MLCFSRPVAKLTQTIVHVGDRHDTPQNHDVWKLAREVAAQMLGNPAPDPTGGALFFHSVELAPPWTKERKRTVEIGRHIFYR